MSKPRCGRPDNDANNAFADTAWRKKALTYYFNNYTPDLSSLQTRSLTTQAFKFWADAAPLHFSERTSGGDIVIRYIPVSTQRCCNVHLTSITVKWRWNDVKTTYCVIMYKDKLYIFYFDLQAAYMKILFHPRPYRHYCIFSVCRAAHLRDNSVKTTRMNVILV